MSGGLGSGHARGLFRLGAAVVSLSRISNLVTSATNIRWPVVRWQQ
ncbi:hypothetical protein L839_1563 [Mycobacterium avium MAV_120809_2495]|nr:hypothetical protein L839_1563 [Mycobacterium avium MAV_120809_2495]